MHDAKNRQAAAMMSRAVIFLALLLGFKSLVEITRLEPLWRLRQKRAT